MRIVPTFGRYLKARFGQRVRKIPLSIPGLTCPNIDGSLGRGGCSYCENESFSPNLKRKSRQNLSFDSPANPLLPLQLEAIGTQYRQSAAYYRKAHGVKAFLAYFQSFSNTYAPLETLKALYAYALSQRGCVGLSIGTRADCLSSESIDYLAELSTQTELWVEIGVQSSHNHTLDAINRMESFEAIAQQVGVLRQRGIKVCAHLIFGLPGESKEQMLQSTQAVVDLGVESIKFHPLYLVKNTALAAHYRQGGFEPIDEQSYLEVLSEAIVSLPEGVWVQRVSAGVDDDSLIAPLWCRRKNPVMAKIKHALRQKGRRY